MVNMVAEVGMGLSQRWATNTSICLPPNKRPEWEEYRRTWRALLFYSKYIPPMLLGIGTVLTWTQLVNIDIGLYLWKQRVGISEAGPCNLSRLPYLHGSRLTFFALFSWPPPTMTQTMGLLRVRLGISFYRLLSNIKCQSYKLR